MVKEIKWDWDKDVYTKTFIIKTKLPITELELVGCLEDTIYENIISVEEVIK